VRTILTVRSEIGPYRRLSIAIIGILFAWQLIVLHSLFAGLLLRGSGFGVPGF